MGLIQIGRHEKDGTTDMMTTTIASGPESFVVRHGSPI